VDPGATVGTLWIEYPRVQLSSQDNGSRPPAGGSFGGATCPRDSGSHLLARDSSGAATCPVALAPASWPGAAPGPPHGTWAPAPTIWLMTALKLPRVLRTGSAGRKANKQIPHGDQAIMISIGVRTRVSSKMLRDKGYSARSQGVQHAAH
jgi:hypothetical protein